MFFASDNSSGVAPSILAALAQANDGYEKGYGQDALMLRVRDQIRSIFEAPEAEVHLVATGTAANALSLAVCSPPWGGVFCHQHAHIAEDECGAPEFFTNGAKLVLVPGPHGRMTPEALHDRITATGGSVHGVQRGMVSLSNVTEAGTIYRAADLAALASTARAFQLPVHLDGARFANAVVASGESPADLSWRSGIDILSFGGTKNGCMGVEAVVIFDPARNPQRSWEFELRRKRGGHLFSKHRYLSAQFAAYLQDGLWLDLAGRANQRGQQLAAGLAALDGVTLNHPVEANMLFPSWSQATNARLKAAGAVYYDWPEPQDNCGARLVTSWSTTEADVDAFLQAVQG